MTTRIGYYFSVKKSTIFFTLLTILIFQSPASFAQYQLHPRDALWFIGATPEDVRITVTTAGFKAIRYSNDRGFFEKDTYYGTVNFEYSVSNDFVDIITWTEFLGEAPPLFNYFIDLGYSTGRNGDIHVFSSPDKRLQVIMEIKRSSHTVEIGISKHPRYRGTITRSYPPKKKTLTIDQTYKSNNATSIPFQGTKYFLDPENQDFVTIVVIKNNQVSTKLVPSVTGQFYKEWLQNKYVIHENHGYFEGGKLFQNDGQKWNFITFQNGKYAEMRPNGENSTTMRLVEFEEIKNKNHFPAL